MTETVLSLRDAAWSLAEENHQYEPRICRTDLFPDPDQKEIRLVHVDLSALESEDMVYPAYFPPSPEDNILFRSAIAMIRPEEDNTSLKLPAGWGDCNSATIRDWN